MVLLQAFADLLPIGSIANNKFALEVNGVEVDSTGGNFIAASGNVRGTTIAHLIKDGDLDLLDKDTIYKYGITKLIVDPTESHATRNHLGPMELLINMPVNLGCFKVSFY